MENKNQSVESIIAAMTSFTKLHVKSYQSLCLENLYSSILNIWQCGTLVGFWQYISSCKILES